LLALLSVIFALWVAVLLWMYFRTIYPARHEANGATAVTQPVQLR
jgi:hypothetical protein